MKPNHQYEPIQTKYTLCKGIEDLYPYEIELPAPPPAEQIINYGLPPDEQVFQRVVIPKEIKALNNLPREAAFAAIERSLEMTAFVEKMWFKFTFGEWQYINGRALHISPTYWFYLNFWKLDIGFPQFRYDLGNFCTDLWEFLWWDYMVQPSEVCYGSIHGSARRSGKTFKALCKAYKRIIGIRNANGSIQSKTEADAVTAFVEKMVTPWASLPFFFKPIHSNSSFPRSEGFKFMPMSKKGAIALGDTINPDDFLFSKITPYGSKETAVDGTKQHIHVSDEDGKFIDGDCWDRHIVVKPCLTQDGGIIGKEICTTTVEDMEKGGGLRFWYKWLMSDRNPDREADKKTVSDDGETVSGLWPWFCPASANEVPDKFGCAIIDEPTDKQKKWLKEVKKDRRWELGGKQRIKQMVAQQKTQLDQQRVMRKYPEEVRDMFLSASGRCLFDIGIINARLKHFSHGYEGTPEHSLMTFGNLVWKGGVFGEEVEFIAGAQETSKYWISYMPRQEHLNKWRIDPYTGKKAPMNWHKFAAGADPFKFDTEDVINKSKMSDGALHIYAEFDVSVDRPDMNPMEYVTDDFCLEYRWREDSMTVDDLCEDYLKACIFYGCKLFPEKNNDDVAKYFKRHGFDHYLQFDMQLKKTNEGMYLQEKGGAGANTDVKSIQSMFKVVQRYVKEKGMRCKFYRTLEDFKFVSPDNMNPYDLFVSAATSLRVVQEFNPIRLKEEDTAEDISDLIGGFSASTPYGNVGRENDYGTDY